MGESVIRAVEQSALESTVRRSVLTPELSTHIFRMLEVAVGRIDSIGRWDLWVHLDTAGTVVIVLLELDVALVTPGSVPGVLDEPVVHAILVAVADDEHSVVEVGAAFARGDDTGRVVLE